jgi:hypothetical protein
MGRDAAVRAVERSAGNTEPEYLDGFARNTKKSE